MNTLAVLIDYRTKVPKVYRGRLETTVFERRKPITINLIDGKHQFFISNIKGFIHHGSRYWITDAHGVRFKLILRHDPRGNEDQPRQTP